MSLAEQIAREHRRVWANGRVCDCGASIPTLLAERAHIATVTEQAARDQVAEEIKAQVIRPCHDDCSLDEGDQRWNIAVDHAARIARGGTDDRWESEGMSDIVEFLLARIAEDEAVARAASPGPWLYTTVGSVGGGTLYDHSRTIGSLIYEQPGEHDGRIVRPLLEHEADVNGRHIARHDPARILAECEAKRRIVEAWADPFGQWNAPQADAARAQKDYTLRLLALPYADHSDFDPAWRIA
jgi:hypothetical protein